MKNIASVAAFSTEFEQINNPELDIRTFVERKNLSSIHNKI